MNRKDSISVLRYNKSFEIWIITTSLLHNICYNSWRGQIPFSVASNKCSPLDKQLQWILPVQVLLMSSYERCRLFRTFSLCRVHPFHSRKPMPHALCLWFPKLDLASDRNLFHVQLRETYLFWDLPYPLWIVTSLQICNSTPAILRTRKRKWPPWRPVWHMDSSQMK